MPLDTTDVPAAPGQWVQATEEDGEFHVTTANAGVRYAFSDSEPPATLIGHWLPPNTERTFQIDGGRFLWVWNTSPALTNLGVTLSW